MAKSLTSDRTVAGQRTSRATIIVAVLLVVYWLVLFCGTHIRIPKGMLPGQSDKLVHFAAYAVLGALLMSLRATRGVYPWYSVYARWFVLSGYGAFDELTQLLVNRNADVMDWLADNVGAAVGLGFVTFTLWLFRKSGKSPSPDLPAADTAQD